ncbi:carbohydrate kinase family protein [Hymenobacter weizhouensis]|uniref:carbohydrate kinase family protein n=1 Tax=Hymenobacter sp. YIM 151500-1 TaxID=2987689 RepID=UPI002226E321|nr:carbohydrate kinase [Hymenobacter sp. YIM 151500-1]UYZ64646.1 carbohydrate kinase [Hymenobacter sp. YIM 151500-1]
MSSKLVCFGEVLWDVLPTAKQPGGAPCNVAVHLHQLGLAVDLISRVGDDELGTELLQFIQSKGLRTDGVQRDKAYPTGVVQANVDDVQEVTYEIVQPVAWDYLEYTPALETLVEQATAVVFGSLAARQATTRATLFRLLEHARFKVFDVNLRPPHYTPEVVQHLLEKADLVKMNHHELHEIMAWLGAEIDESAAVAGLARRFGLQAVCVTKGAAGALLYTNGQLYRAPGVPVQVQDTIGSGDAFLAALLRGWLTGQEPGAALRFACATGALVATHRGATPALTETDVAALLAARAE